MSKTLSLSGHILLLPILATLTAPCASQAAITPTGDVTPTYNGADDPWNMAGSILIGTTLEGSLQIDNGSGVESEGGAVGNTKDGSATVTGAGSTWNNTDLLVVGNQAVGRLTIEAGGVVSGTSSHIAPSTQFSYGIVNVSGSGSTWTNSDDIIVGNNGIGELHIMDAGEVNSDLGVIGVSANAYGTATISGAGSTWNSEVITVAKYGYGSLAVEGGGAVDSVLGVVGKEQNSHGEVVVSGIDSLWDIEFTLEVGTNGKGELSIENGGQINCYDANLGKELYSRGEVTVSGAGANLDIYDDLYVGSDGLGILKIEDGGTVNSGTSTIGFYGYAANTVTVSGSGSVWNTLDGDGRLKIGEAGSGLLQITGGGVVNSINAFVGYGEDANGEVTVSGPGSTWHIDGESYVGYGEGSGKLTIENGGVVNNNNPNAQSNYAGISSVTVSDAGSEWNYDDKLLLCHGSEMAVKNGGQVSSDGSRVEGASSVLVTGAGSWWNLNDPHSSNPSLSINENSELRIENGGHVTSEHDARIGENANGFVTVTGTGSVWEHTGSIFLGQGGVGILQIESGAFVNINGVLILNKGAVNLSGGTLNLNDNQLLLGPPATEFNFTGGRLKDVSSFTSDLIQEGGTLVLDRTSTTDIEGNYHLQNGGLELRVHMSTDGMTASRKVRVEDDIDIAMIGTHLYFEGSGGSLSTGSYTFLETGDGTLTGEFETCDFSDLIVFGATNYTYDIVYNANSAALVISDTGIIGDLDRDGFVGIDDLNTVLTNWNQTVTPGYWPSGDLNGDGFIGIDDLNNILANWNQGSPPPPEVLSTVPEPAGVTMMLLGTLGVTRRRWCV
jgi:T5SS/PEP-CTERM-associated repeat protein